MHINDRYWSKGDILKEINKLRLNTQKNYSFVLNFVAVVLLFGCDSKLGNEDMDVDTACSEPRPEVCTREYAPVCGYKLDRGSKTYSNGCEACAEKEIIGYDNGECL